MKTIKITAAVMAALTAASLASCAKDGQEVPTYMVETEETYTEFVTYPDMDQMSPETMKKEVPMELPFTFRPERIRLYKAIPAEQSYIPDTMAKEVYENGADQYFLFSDRMAFVILTDDKTDNKRTYSYSAYYNEDGRLFYIGDDVYSWYYNESGEIFILAYTYYFEGREIGTTFYDIDGKRMGSISNGLYYDADFNVLDESEQILFLQQLGPVAEIFKGDK